MGDALRATGRPIIYSICNWGENEPWMFGDPAGGQLWRTTGDIGDNWNSMTGILDQQAGLESFARPDAWNDPDMLEVGNGGMTTAEYRAHFSLWALLNAPLIAGQDVRTTSQSTKDILANPDLIAVDQDWGGSQGRRIRDDGDLEVWAKPMADGSVAVALFNRTGGTATIATSAAELGIGGSSSYAVRDLWSKATSTSAAPISAAVPSHAAVVYRVTRAGTAQGTAPAAGTHQVSDLPWLATSNGWGPAERNRSNGEQGAADGVGITIGGAGYAKGIGAHADSAVHVYLAGRCASFTAMVGVDGESTNRGSVRFQVYGDGRYLASARVVGGAAAVPIAVELSGVRTLELRVTDARDGRTSDHADWADAQLTCDAATTRSVAVSGTAFTATNGWGPVERDRANGEQPTDDAGQLTVGGASYARGLGVHAASTVTVPVPAGCRRFRATVGLDAEVGGLGSVTFAVAAAGTTLFSSPPLRGISAARLDVDVTGRPSVDLIVADAADGSSYDHADWADAVFQC
jgi:alpha-galactosidase